MKSVKILAGSIAYWFLAVAIVMVIAAFHGDCGIYDEASAIRACLDEKRTVVLVVGALLVGVYISGLVSTLRQRPDTTTK